MKPRRRAAPLIAFIASVAVTAAACSTAGTSAASPTSDAGAASQSPPATLTVYAAASLKAAVGTAASAYEASHPGTTVTISTDSSAALETQIEQGAPADVFLSADTSNPQKLVDRGLAAGSPIPFAGNKLIVIVPATNPAGIRTPADLARPGVKVVAAGEAVPITKYSTRLVDNLAKQPGYPPDFAARYAANVVSREDNVGAVVSKIELGEGDAAVCYVTDAKASTKVRTVDVPDAANVPATYAGVVLRASRNREAAEAFLAWFAGPNGRSILASFGFLPPS